MKYVDGFVVAVPADKKDAYREMAAKAAPLFKEFGALRSVLLRWFVLLPSILMFYAVNYP